MPSPDLTPFATALAERLPGSWSTDIHWRPADAEDFPLAPMLWGEGMLTYILDETPVRENAVLTGPGNIRLCIAHHPYRTQFLIGALIPLGIDQRHLVHPKPPSILVDSNPVRAAADVSRRLLPHYARSLEAVHQRVAAETAVLDDTARRLGDVSRHSGHFVATTLPPMPPAAAGRRRAA